MARATLSKLPRCIINGSSQDVEFRPIPDNDKMCMSSGNNKPEIRGSSSDAQCNWRKYVLQYDARRSEAFRKPRLKTWQMPRPQEARRRGRARKSRQRHPHPKASYGVIQRLLHNKINLLDMFPGSQLRNNAAKSVCILICV